MTQCSTIIVNGRAAGVPTDPRLNGNRQAGGTASGETWLDLKPWTRAIEGMGWTGGMRVKRYEEKYNKIKKLKLSTQIISSNCR